MPSKTTPALATETKSDISPAVSTDSLFRFIAFTLALITMPLTTFYLCAYKIPFFAGSTTLAGALAAVVANVVLVMYLGIVMFEDNEERKAELDEKDRKKKE